MFRCEGKDYGIKIQNYLLDLHPDWKWIEGEPLKERNEKIEKYRKERSLLTTYTHAAVVALKKELEQDPRYNSEWKWGECDDALKAKYLDLTERIVSAGGIPIDKCVDSWMAQALMSCGAQHRLGPKKVFLFLLLLLLSQ